MKIYLRDLLAALEENEASLSNLGFCLACGSQQDNCEPDASNYTCNECGERQVFGAEHILISGEYTCTPKESPHDSTL